MRLTCPSCKAQYEVADSVIPPEGRDVQCSSCGTTWFQYPVSVALQMRAADLDDDDDEDDGDGRPAATPASDQPGAAPAPRIDRTVLDVLRQEAERELGERRRQRPGIETQSDLGLVARPRARSADPGTRPAAPAAGGGPAPSAEPSGGSSRRSLLPDVEELSSTLEPQPEAPDDDAGAPEPAQRGRDFRRGLSAVVLVAAVLVGLYLLAPGLAEMVPALAGPLAGYVAMIDALRQMFAGLVGAG